MASSDEKKSTRGASAKETKQVVRVGMFLMAASVIFQLIFALLVHYNVARLYPSSMVGPETLRGFSTRLEYTLRYQSLLGFWLMFNIVAVIYGRVTSLALNPLEDRTEVRIQLFKNVLNNSFETIIVSVFAQLTFISFADPNIILKFIPYINIVQFIGRVAFFAGYPMKRSFGYSCGLYSNLFLVTYNVYRLGSFVGLY